MRNEVQMDLDTIHYSFRRILKRLLLNWNLASNPVIEPEYSSGYMQNLVRKATKNSLLRYMDPLIQRFVKSP